LGLLRVGRFARFGSAARDVGDALRFFTRLPAPGSGETIAHAAPRAELLADPPARDAHLTATKKAGR